MKNYELYWTEMIKTLNKLKISSVLLLKFQKLKVHVNHFNKPKDLRQERYWRFGKPILAVLVSYTGYICYISLKTRYSIIEREKMLNDGPIIDYKSTLIKYSPLTILGRFKNPFIEYRIQTICEFFANRILELFQNQGYSVLSSKKLMDELMPVHKPRWTDNGVVNNHVSIINYKVLGPKDEITNVVQGVKSSPIYITWLGQSCNFVLYKDLKIVTDPLFSDYLIHKNYGPKRITSLPENIENVPIPDLILVSHNHPDHLDEISMHYWGKECNNQPLWIIPRGLSSFIKSHGVTNYVELSWWETFQVTIKNEAGLVQLFEISCTPAMHWSGRSIVDTNKSLWCSFLLRDEGKPILFHAGDTGYVKDLYTRIASRFGSGVKLALLPCGQYCPQWHQRPRHINPDEVIKIMKDMNAENVLGIHWGTFVLSSEYFREPKEKLEMLAKQKGINDRCYCPELGKTITIK